jgi:type IV pilus assembly protein PilV
MSITGFKQKHQGMTLVEVLVAAIIVAIGLLGVASLQTAALQGASDADYRSKAVDLATALADRMHANLIGVADNHYLGIPVCGAGSVSNCAMTPTMDNSASVVQCTAQEMAEYDLEKISCGPGIEESLPNGQLEVSCLDADTSDGDICSHLSRLLIRITWEGQGRANDTAPVNEHEIVVTVIPGAP